MSDNEGDKLKFNFSGAYIIPEADRLKFNFTHSSSSGEQQIVYVTGIVTTLAVGEVNTKNNQNFILALGFNTFSAGRPSVRYASSPERPAPNAISFNFDQQPYLKPYPDAVWFEFLSAPISVCALRRVYPYRIYSTLAFGTARIWLKQQWIDAVGLDSAKFGKPSLMKWHTFAYPIGFTATLHGRPEVYNRNRTLRITGWNSENIGNASLVNKNKNILGQGISSKAVLGIATIYNLKQFVRPVGLYSVAFGAPVMKGGQRTLLSTGIYSQSFGAPNIRNRTFVQTLKPYAIASRITLGQPAVYPLRLSPNGFSMLALGMPTVEFAPKTFPKGFQSDKYGEPWVSFRTRSIQPAGYSSLEFPNPNIRDKAQRISVFSATNTSTVFGDALIKNKNIHISINGFDAFGASKLHSIKSNLQNVEFNGWKLVGFGVATIHNKTPSISPIGIDSLLFSHAFIGYRIRTLYTSGFNSASFGTATILNNSQGAFAKSFLSMALGNPWISHYRRTIETTGKNQQLFGSHIVWPKNRKVLVSGMDMLSIGKPDVSHEERRILLQGIVPPALGSGFRISFFKQYIYPVWPDKNNNTNHMIGGHQHINVQGFDAVRFGTRIIPESQSIYVPAIKGEVGMPAVSFKNRRLYAKSSGNIGSHDDLRWGMPSVFNLRQYIVQYAITGSGLEPPVIGIRSLIENRNRHIRPAGYDQSKVSKLATFENGARVVKPAGLNSQSFGTHMVAHRIRRIKPEGMDLFISSRWHILYNSARVIQHKGWQLSKVGMPSIENTRRYFRWIGAFDSFESGKPMIDFAIRKIQLNGRGIANPTIRMPEVKLHTRYIEAHGVETLSMGYADTMIHWNKVKPWWNHKNYFGYPEVKNWNPEAHALGLFSEEMGKPSVHLYKRYLQINGLGSALYGKPLVEFRTKSIGKAGGIKQPEISMLHKVIKTASPPYTRQIIDLDGVLNEKGEKGKGHGIEAPFSGTPSVRSNVIFVGGFNSLKMGNVFAQSNGIIMDYGIFLAENAFGLPLVSAKNRRISLDNQGISSEIQVSNPSFSPHRIYATVEAPAQAIANHPLHNLHRVGELNNASGQGSMEFGYPVVTLRHRVLQVYGLSSLAIGNPDTKLMKHYVSVKGWLSYRGGFSKISDTTDQQITVNGSDSATFGTVKIGIAPQLNRQIHPQAITLVKFGGAYIDFYHRSVKPQSFNSLAMGRSEGGNNYLPQSLHIGFRMPTNIEGFESAKYGKPWISLKVRDLSVSSFDSLLMEYDLKNFDKRMRVQRVEKQLPVPPAQHICPAGFDSSQHTVPNIKAGVHYIRPDGNSDQYRKGAPKWL